MEKARIHELLAPFLEGKSLSNIQLRNISTYVDVLLRWNARINLTAVREPEEIITRHFGESFFLARQLFPEDDSGTTRRAGSDVDVDVHAGPGLDVDPGLRPGRGDSSPGPFRAADLGSGAGFPGIPLKLWRPDLGLTLIESNQKKATFLGEIIRTLTLTYIDVLAGRAETLPPASFDLVTMRAVERFEEALSAGVALVCSRGRVALLVGENQALRLRALQPRFHWDVAIPVPQSRQRVVVIGMREST